MIAYITKNCLSKGIRRMEGIVLEDGTFKAGDEIFMPKEWHKDEQSARCLAESIRKDKIRSSRRYADKLERMSFRSTDGDSHVS